MSFKDIDIRREIILDHYEHPKFKIENELKAFKTYNKAHRDSPSCVDNLTVYVKVNKNKIQDIKFSGIGCAIATSSTDIMASILKNKTIKQANLIISNYLNMLNGQKYDQKILKDLYVFENLNKQLNRIKCGKVGIEAMQLAINKV